MANPPDFNKTATFVITLSRPYAQPVSVRWATQDGTAKAGVDYQAAAGIANFAPGQMAFAIAIPCVTPAGNETKQFSLALSNAVNTVIDAGNSNPVIMAPPKLYLKGDRGSIILITPGKPGDDIGNDQDISYDLTQDDRVLGDVYQKQKGTWSKVGNIRGPAGKPGDKGDPGPPLNNRGDWVSGTTYQKGDYVFAPNPDGGSRVPFFLLDTEEYTSTTTPGADPTHWLIFPLKAGADGREVKIQTANGFIQWQYEGDDEWQNLVALADLKGGKGDDGREVNIRSANGYIQWQYVGDTAWQNLVALADLQGGKGDNGREVVIRNDGNNIQWQYAGDTVWQNIVALADLKGPKGDNGREVKLQSSGGYIQWQYDGDTVWLNLVALADLQGPAGKGLTPKGQWVTGTTYNPAEYVVSKSSDGTTDAMWLLKDTSPYLSKIAPAQDTDHWLVMSGTKGDDGREVEIQAANGFIQWRYAGDTAWQNIVALADLKGGKGDDGREVSIRNDGSNIQWQYAGDTAWQNIVALADLKGPKGDNGREVKLQSSGGYIQWQYVGDTTWLNLVALADLQGGKGDDGREVSIRNDGTYIQWQYVKDTDWQNIVALADLKGGKGDDGREVKMQSSGGYIQWQYAGDTVWLNLVALADLQGPKGDKGDSPALTPAKANALGTVMVPPDGGIALDEYGNISLDPKLPALPYLKGVPVLIGGTGADGEIYGREAGFTAEGYPFLTYHDANNAAVKKTLAEQARSLLNGGYGGVTQVTQWRNFNTDFTNSSGRPYLVLLTLSIGNTWISGRINGADTTVINYSGQSLTGQIQLPMTLIIPVGATYSVVSGDTSLSKVINWWEG